MKTLEEMEQMEQVMEQTGAQMKAQSKLVKVINEVDRKFEAHRKNRQGSMLVHSPLAFSIREVNTNSQYWVGEKRDV